MGSSLSALFKRAAGDVMLAATRKFPNPSHKSVRRIEGAAMRVAYAAICLASLVPLRWDPAGECVSFGGGQVDPTEMARLVARVLHERLDYVDLWRILVVVGEKVRKVHVDCIKGERLARKVRKFHIDQDDGIHDGHFVLTEGETVGTMWHDVQMWVADHIPIQSHETLVGVVEGAARLCCEEVLRHHVDKFVFMDPSGGYVVSKYIMNDQEDHNARVDLLSKDGLLAHLAKQVKEQGAAIAADGVIREIEALVDRIRRTEDKALKDKDRQRPLSVNAPSAARYMMSIDSISIGSDALPTGATAKSPPLAIVMASDIGGSLEPDMDVARERARKLLRQAFTAIYDAPAPAYSGGLAASKKIAADIVDVCYACYTLPRITISIEIKT